MENIISGRISDAINAINSDKERLNNIINAINSGNSGDTINDKMINNLTNLDLKNDEDTFEMVIEFLAIILSNIESQKIANTKQITEELVKILSHNLDLLKNLELCIENFDNKILSCPISTNTIDKNKPNNSDEHWFMKMFMPKSTIANSIMWIIVFLLVFVAIKSYDSEAVNDFGNITEKILHTTKVGPNGTK